jgi:hemerythrin-like domain-containing protein
MALKRHLALQDYSREHHDELMLVWKIREGLKKNISPKRIIDYCVHHYNEKTSLHMANEEKYILNNLPQNDQDRIKILHEHNEIKELVKKLSKNSSDSNLLLSEFAEKLEKHVRYEERTFFPKLQNTFPVDVMNSMQPSESKANECTVWKDSFWEK